MKFLLGCLLLAAGFAFAILCSSADAPIRAFLPRGVASLVVTWDGGRVGLWALAIMLATIGAAGLVGGTGLRRVSMTAHHMFGSAVMLLTTMGLLLLADPGKFEASDIGPLLGWCLGGGVLLGALQTLADRFAKDEPEDDDPRKRRRYVRNYVAPPEPTPGGGSDT